jgi:hypothetical protein
MTWKITSRSYRQNLLEVWPLGFNASNSCKIRSSGNVSSRLPINPSTCRRTSGSWPRASITARAVSITMRRNGRLFTIYETRTRRESRAAAAQSCAVPQTPMTSALILTHPAIKNDSRAILSAGALRKRWMECIMVTSGRSGLLAHSEIHRHVDEIIFCGNNTTLR